MIEILYQLFRQLTKPESTSKAKAPIANTTRYIKSVDRQHGITPAGCRVLSDPRAFYELAKSAVRNSEDFFVKRPKIENCAENYTNLAMHKAQCLC